ncbi:SGNH/GDSL hydrolase family protein [Flagellimonas sp.]|uniref:SGNH/GDSL hydrolase family protein n=1 Tax=Flagellimonas sp. TaxID=2058762 RepID=UPI003B51DC35
MKYSKKCISTLFFTLALISTQLGAQNFKNTQEKVQLEDGDTFVFIGNSITHQCAYTQYVEDFFYTRYPDKKLNIVNAGVSGDFAGDVLKRLEEDVLKHQPKYASILIGMNDGEYARWNDTIFNTYKKDMLELTQKLVNAQVKPLLLTPTIFDTHQALLGENWVDKEQIPDLHYDAVLAYFGAWCLEQANLQGYGYADLHGYLTHYTREARKKDADFTFIPDAVHPEFDGQLVMAVALLEGMGVNAKVTEIEVDKRDGNWNYASKNGTLSNEKSEAIEFDFKANALPWVVPVDAQYAFDLTDAGSRLGAEIIRVVGLEYGNYHVIIDNITVGAYSHMDLAKGVELQNNPRTPQYRQALAVAELNKKRNEEVIEKVRDEWLLRKGLANPEVMEEEEEEEDLSGDPEYQRYLRLREMGYERYVQDEFAKVIQELESTSKKMIDEIYQINQPKTLHYSVVRAEK